MRYVRDVLRKNRGLALFYVLLGILSAFLTNWKASYFQQVVDGLTDRSIGFSAILLYGALLAAGFLIGYLEEYPAKKLEHGIYLDFKLLALKKISRIDYLEYRKLGTGQLVQRIENGAQAGKNILTGFWLCILRQLIPTICFSVYFIWRINRPITYAILGGYAVVFLITNLLLKALYRIKERLLVNEEQLNRYLVRSFMEMPVFRLEGQFPAELRKAALAKKQIVRAKVKMNLIHEAFFTAFALLVAALDVIVLLYAWRTGNVSVGAAAALLSLLDNAYTPIAIFNVLYVQYKLDRTAFRRYEEFLSLKDDPGLEQGSSLASCRGEIAVKKLSFSYEGREIFRELDLKIQPGEKVALIGESGSGKSTLLKILAGFAKYHAGSVEIDGRRLEELRLEDLYRHVSYLSQEPSVFDGTLRENLAFGREIPEDRLADALEQACLGPLLKDLPNGMDTEIGERGSLLSGGEKQRIALARLWLERKEIVILDEATSAMDSVTEETVMARAVSMLEGKTVIAVAHRLSAVADFDRLIVFRLGKIVGQGTFQELMESNPYFQELYRASLV